MTRANAANGDTPFAQLRGKDEIGCVVGWKRALGTYYDWWGRAFVKKGTLNDLNSAEGQDISIYCSTTSIPRPLIIAIILLFRKKYRKNFTEKTVSFSRESSSNAGIGSGIGRALSLSLSLLDL